MLSFYIKILLYIILISSYTIYTIKRSKIEHFSDNNKYIKENKYNIQDTKNKVIKFVREYEKKNQDIHFYIDPTYGKYGRLKPLSSDDYIDIIVSQYITLDSFRLYPQQIKEYIQDNYGPFSVIYLDKKYKKYPPTFKTIKGNIITQINPIQPEQVIDWSEIDKIIAFLRKNKDGSISIEDVLNFKKKYIAYREYKNSIIKKRKLPHDSYPRDNNMIFYKHNYENIKNNNSHKNELISSNFLETGINEYKTIDEFKKTVKKNVKKFDGLHKKKNYIQPLNYIDEQTSNNIGGEDEIENRLHRSLDWGKQRFWFENTAKINQTW
tara:strand:+ start:1701 stop:2669 length:969 start_codon:yes stop_codon:yes gene_type:complete